MVRISTTILMASLVSCSEAEFVTSGQTPTLKPPTSEQHQSAIPQGQFPNDITISSGSTSQKKISTAMLVNDFKCGVCHTTVRGPVVSLDTVPEVWETSDLVVKGDWYINGDLQAGMAPDRSVQTEGTVHTNYRGEKLPKNTEGEVNFPEFPNVNQLKQVSKGTVKSQQTTVINLTNGNAVLIGTKDSPIEINGEVFIDGDLIIKGYYRGVGSIYATGRIYVPANLIALSSPFPYDDDISKARDQGFAKLKGRFDALGLASKVAVIVGYFDDTSGTKSVFEHKETPGEYNASAIAMRNVYSWYTGGKTAFETLFEAGEQCSRLTHFLPHTLSRIDAFLYAGNSIGGRAAGNSYAINGGIITKHFHIISGARDCVDDSAHPVHGYPRNRNHINYDWRFDFQRMVLKQLSY